MPLHVLCGAKGVFKNNYQASMETPASFFETVLNPGKTTEMHLLV
jgi:hypothetical protein